MMEDEQLAIQHQQVQQLLFFIKETYSGKNTEQVKRAQNNIFNILHKHPSFIIKMFDLLATPSHDTNFRHSVSNIIKKQYYKIAQRSDINKKAYVLGCYQFLLSTNHQNIRYKQHIGSALEYIFNKDQRMEYKNQVANDCYAKIDSFVKNMENWSLQTTIQLQGIITTYIAYMNSLIEPQDILDFILKILPGICLSASICLRFATNNLQTGTPHSLLFLAGKKIFQLIEMAVQRLMDEEQLVSEEDIGRLKNHEMVHNIITDYLYQQNIDSSILSPYPDLNQTKQSAMQILNFLNIWDAPIPKGTINSLLYTFLKQSTQASSERRQQEQDDYKDQILCRVMQILQSCLEHKKFYSLFLDFKIAILFALMMYSRTEPSQQQNLYEEPYKFAQLSEQYSQTFARSPILKVRAANFLKTYLKSIDEGLKNLMELLTIFITSSLCADSADSPIMAAFKNDLGKFDFWGLTNRQKLDVSFMVLTVMAPLVQNKNSILQTIYSLLAVNMKLFNEINDDLILCRLVRLIGYYPFASYFYFIQQKMGLNKAIYVEGIVAFERIIKNPQYLKTFPMMYSVFHDLIDMIHVKQSIFEQLVLNHYNDIICKSDYLFKKILQKIWETFKQSFEQSNDHQMRKLKDRHAAIVCLNYIDKILKKQRREKNNDMVLELIRQMGHIAQNYEILYQNIIGINHTIINKFLLLDKQAQQFAVQFTSLNILQRLSFPTELYLFLNKLILKSDNFLIIQTILSNLQSYLVTAHTQQFDKNFLPHLCLIIGQISTTNLSVQISQKAVDYVLQWILARNNQQKQAYQSMLFLCLNYINLKPAQVREYLLLKDLYYTFMLNIFNTKLSTKINRKAFVLAINSLIVFEPERSLCQKMIKNCIHTLASQSHRYKNQERIVKHCRTKTDATMRRVLNMNFINDEQPEQPARVAVRMIEQQRMENDDEKQNYEIYKGLKHPFDKIDQFQMFKHTLQSLQFWKQLVEPEDMQILSNIFSTSWHKQKVRNIVRVKRDIQ